MAAFTLLYFTLFVASLGKNNRYLIWLIAAIYILLLGLRALTVGVDTVTYSEIFYDITTYGYNGYPEPLFGYTIENLAHFNVEYISFQFLLALFTIILVSHTCSKYSPAPIKSLFLFLALYFLFYAMNVSRQILAVSVLLMGYGLLYKGSIVKFLGCVCIATMIHYISIFALIVLIFRKVNITKKLRLWFILAASFAIGLILSDSLIIRMLTPIIGNYAEYLLNSGTNGFREESRLLLAVILCLFWTALFVIIALSSKKHLFNNLWFKIYLLGVITNNLTLRMELGLRVTMLFSISQIILFPLYTINNKFSKPIYGYYIVSLFATLFFFLFLSNNSAGILPYHFATSN